MLLTEETWSISSSLNGWPSWPRYTPVSGTGSLWSEEGGKKDVLMGLAKADLSHLVIHM